MPITRKKCQRISKGYSFGRNKSRNSGKKKGNMARL